MLDEIGGELKELKAAGLLRELRQVAYLDGMKARVEGKECVVFCSNDYLGLARDDRVKRAAAEAAEEYGAGSGASRLVCGDLPIHAQLEDQLARFKGLERVAVFPTGYQANLGVITSLVGKGDLVVCDRLNHASIIDACRLSSAKLLVYSHSDLAGLERCLNRRGVPPRAPKHTARLFESTAAPGNNSETSVCRGGSQTRPYRRTLIVTDSVFSMDGDRAPLAAVCRLAKQHGAMLMVDEAHATGVCGDKGQGLAHELGLVGEIDVHMGTLSKALGSQGGFVAGSGELIALLHNRARSFIYTTGLNPAACGAALEAIELLEREEAGRHQLLENTLRLRSGLNAAGLEVEKEGTPIVPLVIGEAEKAMRLASGLLEAGYFVPAIRPPTVPKGTSRLRITVSAVHTEAEIDGLVKAIVDIV